MRKLNPQTAGFALVLVMTLQSGCAETKIATQPTTVPETSQKSVTEPATPIQAPILAGKVTETMDSGGYTYVNIEKDGKTSWVALPLTKIKVGEEIEVMPGMRMGKFTSKTLNKTFDEIMFSSGVVTTATPKLPAGHKPIDVKPKADQAEPSKVAKPKQKHMGMTSQPDQGTAAISGKVLETMDSGGYTYVNLESDGKKIWAAIPVTPVKAGQQLTLQPGMKMNNFTSKSLNRTFDSVIFSGGIITETK